MKKNPQPDSHEFGLDRHLLSTPCEFQTNWIVITGSSCSGKTTLINLLAENRYPVVPESARQYIEGELARGNTLDEIRSDQAALTRRIYRNWLECLGELNPEQFLFLDRGLPDALAFFRYTGMDPNKILLDCLKYRYAFVFKLDRLPYQRDGVRSGDDKYAEYFDDWLSRDYLALGYDPVRVPVLPPEGRLEFVLDKLSKWGILQQQKCD
jgi:predicted ATPase